jgi:hypothetical protein
MPIGNQILPSLKFHRPKSNLANSSHSKTIVYRPLEVFGNIKTKFREIVRNAELDKDGITTPPGDDSTSLVIRPIVGVAGAQEGSHVAEGAGL